MSKRLYNIYEPDEIIRRLIKECEPLDGPSGYPVQIKYVAGNTHEPPVIYFDLYEGDDRCVFDMYCDQNTTLAEFEKKLYSVRPFGLRRCVGLCCKAIKNKTSFDTEWAREAKDETTDDTEDDLPF